MGHKSKFTFPMPGRCAKPPPTSTVTSPISKAEKILGTNGVCFGSPPVLGRDAGRMWEEGSTGGISISISESSASQSGFMDDNDYDDDKFAGTTYGRALWEEESEALPRRLRVDQTPQAKGLKPKRSAITLGAHNRDNMTDEVLARRPRSSSTVVSHYESAKVPLSISQQTSNSAMAKGLPSKAGALLDIDGMHNSKEQPRKKPSRLDFSRLRFRHRKDQTTLDTNVGPVLGNNYVMKSPSVMSHMSNSVVSLPRASPMSPESDPKGSRQDLRVPTQALTQAPARQSRSRGAADTGNLHNLYDHYEQMSFRDTGDIKEDIEEERAGEEDDEEAQFGTQRLLPRTYTPVNGDVSREDMITPLPNAVHKDHSSGWNHSRNTSQASKVTATRSGTPSTLQIRPSSRNDYPASVSSRHTRTSKATPSVTSALDSDRQQHSVLSLSDSDSDEEEASDSRPGSSLPSYDNSFRDDTSESSSQRQMGTSRLSISSHSTNPKGTSYAQLNDFLTIPFASPKCKGTRSPSANTILSTNSTLSTATRLSQAQQDPRGSVSTIGTSCSNMISPTFSNMTACTLQEARAIAFTPLNFAPHIAHAASSSANQTSHNANHTYPQQQRQRMSQNSHTSDQPTPPLSPTSIEFLRKSTESARQEAASASASTYDSRMMAVTKQEEMLLAALRKKRARMRENIIAEIEEDNRGGRGSIGEEDIEKIASARLKEAERQAIKETKDAREARARAAQPRSYSTRASSLMGRTGERPGSRQSQTREQPRGPRIVDVRPSTSHSTFSERQSRASKATPPMPESSRTVKARHERVLLYLDRPIDSIDVIDQAEPSPDLSEFLDFELDFPMPNRQSQTSQLSQARPKLGSDLHSSPFQGHGRPRPDSSPVSPKSNPLQDMARVRARVIDNFVDYDDDDEDDDDDDDDYIGDIDFDDFPEIVSRRKPPPPALQSVPEKEVPRPDSPVSAAFQILPATTYCHKKGKKSAARLSAVGQINSPVPWWGDDD